MKAATSGGNTAIAVRGKKSAAFIAQKKVPVWTDHYIRFFVLFFSNQDRLVDPTSLTSIHKITDTIGCLTIGLSGNFPFFIVSLLLNNVSADIKAQIERIRYEANEFWFNNGFSMPPHALAKRVADICQVYTQEASSRALAVVMLFIGFDDEKGSQVFKVDPTGHYLPYKAVAMGKFEPEAMNFLEKRVTDLGELDEENTVEMAIMAMQHVLSSDFKSNEIEVGVVSEGKKFRVLSEQEIEARVNSISEKSEL